MLVLYPGGGVFLAKAELVRLQTQDWHQQCDQRSRLEPMSSGDDVDENEMMVTILMMRKKMVFIKSKSTSSLSEVLHLNDIGQPTHTSCQMWYQALLSKSLWSIIEYHFTNISSRCWTSVGTGWATWGRACWPRPSRSTPGSGLWSAMIHYLHLHYII